MEIQRQRMVEDQQLWSAVGAVHPDYDQIIHTMEFDLFCLSRNLSRLTAAYEYIDAISAYKKEKEDEKYIKDRLVTLIESKDQERVAREIQEDINRNLPPHKDNCMCKWCNLGKLVREFCSGQQLDMSKSKYMRNLEILTESVEPSPDFITALLSRQLPPADFVRELISRGEPTNKSLVMLGLFGAPDSSEEDLGLFGKTYSSMRLINNLAAICLQIQANFEIRGEDVYLWRG